jgi:hypothetical protein
MLVPAQVVRATVRAAKTGKRHFAAGAVVLKTPEYRGVVPSEWSVRPEFKRSAGNFSIYQQMNAAGELVPGAEKPLFSLEEAVRMYECMVRSHVYDGVFLQLQRQGRISFY